MSVANVECNSVIKTLTKSESLEDFQTIFSKPNTCNTCNMRKIEIRSDVFEGYFVWVDVSKCNKIDEIIHHVKIQLLNFLITFNLKNLVNYAKKMTLKFFIFTSYDELMKKTRENDTIYLYDARC